MWLLLDISLIRADVSSPVVTSALEQILYAIARGQHVLVASTDVIKHVGQAVKGIRTRAALRTIQNRASELLSEIRNQKLHVLIVLDEGPIEFAEKQSHWRMPLSWFHANGLPDACLVAENFRDAKLLEIAAMQSSVAAGSGTSVKIQIKNGGGADTPGVLQQLLVAKDHFILCITDSDKAWPGAAVNLTSQRCARALQPSVDGGLGEANGLLGSVVARHWIAAHAPLLPREIENLIPIEFIEDAIEAPRAPDLQKRLDKLHEARSHAEACWIYLDLKETLLLKKVIGEPFDFWQPIIEWRLEESNEIDEGCVEMKSCKNQQKCSCALVPGLMTNVTDHVISLLEKNGVHKSLRTLTNSTSADLWRGVGAAVLNWAAAIKPTRA